MINAIVIDDERHSCDALKMLLEKCCPQVLVAAICHTGEEGIKKNFRIKTRAYFPRY